MTGGMGTNSTGQLQLEALDKLTDNLTGFPKVIAKKILNGDFIENVKNLTGSDVTKAKDALKNIMDDATLKAANTIRFKITMLLIAIVIILAVLATIITFGAGGNILIPIVIAIILVLIIRFVGIMLTKSIASKVSSIIFEKIEGEITKFTIKNKEV